MSHGFVVVLDSRTARQTDSRTDNHIQDTDVLDTHQETEQGMRWVDKSSVGTDRQKCL